MLQAIKTYQTKIKKILLSGKTFQTKQIRADTSHEVSALLVIFVFAKLKHNHEQI